MFEVTGLAITYNIRRNTYNGLDLPFPREYYLDWDNLNTLIPEYEAIGFSDASIPIASLQNEIKIDITLDELLAAYEKELID